VLCVAKKNNLCCFKYKQVPDKDNSDKPCDKHGPSVAPIVKNGAKGKPPNGEKGTNEPQENIYENPKDKSPDETGTKDSPV